MKSFQEFLNERSFKPSEKMRDDDTLFRYIRNNNLEEAEKLLQSGVNPDTLDEDTQRTPLFYAKGFDAIELLINHGADIDHRDEDNKTPILFHQTKSGGKPYIAFMDKLGADLFAMDKSDNTILDSHTEAMDYLLENKIQSKFKKPLRGISKTGEMIDLDALKKAIELGYKFDLNDMLYSVGLDMETLEYVLQNTKVDQKAFDKWYTKYGVKKEAIELFLKNGYKLFKKHIYRTPTTYAETHSSHFKTHYENQEKMKKKDSSIIFDLVDQKDIKGIEGLLSEGKDFFEVFKEEASPLMYAISKANYDIAMLLIENKINIISTSKNGFGALVYAIKKGKDDLVQALINAKANVNIKAKDKTTPLMWASYMGDEHLDTVKLLVDSGAKLNEVADKHTALDFTNKSRFYTDKVQAYLKSKGAKSFEEL